MSEEYKPGNFDQIDTEDKQKIELPKKYKVILHNDDYTPMEFVVEILIEIFHKDELTATNIMLNVHNLGRGVCGVYTYEIAETKIARVADLAQQYEYPLKASMEAE
ncbi:MAG: ATP-dependent Clp protease adapter ClpS [bacterium]|nr:ATP-dependent Clp protease adapter ClpS [bacterium]